MKCQGRGCETISDVGTTLTAEPPGLDDQRLVGNQGLVERLRLPWPSPGGAIGPNLLGNQGVIEQLGLSSQPQVGLSTAGGSVVNEPNPEAECHECVHEMHFANGARGGPPASRDALERDAVVGARALLNGFDYHTSLAASPDMVLAYEPGPDSGPCEITTDALTNRALVQWLGWARARFSALGRSDDGYFDWANLLRRLEATRRRRRDSGHAWIATTGLREVPSELLLIDGSEGNYVTVRQVSGAEVGTQTSAGGRVYVTPAQFERFLEHNNVPRHSIEATVGGYYAVGPTMTIPLNPAEVTAPTPYYFQSVGPYDPLMTMPWLDVSSFGGPLGGVIEYYDFRYPYSPFDPFMGRSPFGFPGTQPLGIWLADRQGEEVTYTPTAAEQVAQLFHHPSMFTSQGRDLMFLPAPSPLFADPVPGPLLAPQPAMSPAALAFLAAPPIGLPENTTGVLWGEGHAVDFVVVQGRMVTGGFRASMARHLWSDVERAPGLGGQVYGRAGGPATASLNRGVPGTYANDALFPLMPGSVVVYRQSGDPVNAETVFRMMAEAPEQLNGQIYRYSPPPPGHPAHERAFGPQGPDFCAPGAQNCINLPMDIHRQALGGDHMVIVRQDGTLVMLADPATARAGEARVWAGTATARELERLGYQAVPDEFFTQRGLVRQRITGQAVRGTAIATLMGSGLGLAGDAFGHATTGQAPNYGANLALNTGIGGAGVVAENYLANYATLRIGTAGMSSGASMTLGRAAGGTPVAMVAAPLITGGTMVFDSHEYASADYYSRMGRSSISAGGGALAGALATGGYFALAGSEVPILGNAVGFVVGFGGYLLVDYLVGDTVEEAIFDASGGQGCADGIGPGR